MVKVKAKGPYTIKNSKLGISYKFEAGKEYEVNKNHINVLLEAGVCEEVKNGKL